MAADKYRLVTRSDFDGLVCAVLLKELDLIDDIKFVHPKDMQDGVIDITARDITTNLPYVPGCYLCFDHHHSETVRVDQGQGLPANMIIDGEAPSAARVVYEYFGGKEKLPGISDDMMVEVDKADSAQYNEDEVLFADGWALLNFLMDARTGLGRFRHFRISNYELMMQLIDYCRNHTIAEILALPDVKERVDLYFEEETLFKTQIQMRTKIHENLAVLDLRMDETIHAGNRFIVYALYPQCNISMHVLWGKDRKNTVFALGKSIFNRTSKTNIGELCLKYGGGGHHAAGTCQVPNADYMRVQQELMRAILADG
ncbi:exopolyphosphatase-related protein [Magnetococcus marinus MC-1]|uniref:Exopolyphosphatase-related protein n=1 Tax=Magnetococcus marinus (strain ATCC BAA-1437 / JCM 17883 / MC-1) TaxID=156889 RepID=A0LBV8_MAGMM|nr:exopolyphosphatase [Magnetococcus marinus]ABK45451.1 exopolyphosphatase-related protein [Magnetococcus marinus MC-1]